MSSFYSELKRRHVFRVAAVYVVTCWVLAQAADFLLESFGAPEWVVQSIVVLLFLGFPVALILAWATELTPEGIRLTGDEPIPSTALTAPSDDIVAPAALNYAHSIAVLPFADMSVDKDQEYFSDGLAEELLNMLAQIPQLHVASRTSAFSFKGKAEDIQVIAQRLNVNHVLEGSVRKSGEKVRVTAQLIKAEDGFHLWSESFDRPLDNIFAVQDEIAQSVVEVLKLKLLGEAPKSKETHPDAYSLHLKGVHFNTMRKQEDLLEAVNCFEQALEIDPDYAPAWSGLSFTYMIMGGSGGAGWEKSAALSREALGKALKLDPKLADAWMNASALKSYYDWDWTGAQSDIERARELAPNNSNLLDVEARLARSQGELERSIQLADQSIGLDPLNQGAQCDRARALLYLGHYDQSEAAYKALLLINPLHHNAKSMLSRVYLARGEVERALANRDENVSPFWQDFTQLLALYSHRRDSQVEAKLAQFIEEYQNEGAFQIAEIYALGGSKDEAFHWLARAYEQRDPGLADELLVTNSLRSLHSDPRWAPLVDKLGLLAAYQAMPTLNPVI
jgi:TolB-like protein